MPSNIKAELIKNKEAETAQYVYEKQVLARIDSAFGWPKRSRAKIIANDAFNDKLLFPEGVIKPRPEFHCLGDSQAAQSLPPK